MVLWSVVRSPGAFDSREQATRLFSGSSSRVVGKVLHCSFPMEMAREIRKQVKPFIGSGKSDTSPEWQGLSAFAVNRARVHACVDARA